MHRHLKTSLNYLLIALFLLLGFIGLALPLVPQAIFFAIALILISFEVPSVEQYIERKLNKESILGKTYLGIKEKVEKYLR